MTDSEIIKITKAGSLKRQYLLAKNALNKPIKFSDDFQFIRDTFQKLVNELDELILFEVDDK